MAAANVTSSGILLAQDADGPALAGIFMNVMLYGVMITQTFFYFSAHSDPLWMRIYVGVLFLADTLNTIFNIAWIYGVFVNNFGVTSALGVGNWLFETEEALAGIIAMQVQLFYAWRIYRLTRSKLTTACVVIPSVVGGLSGIGTAIAVALRPEFSGFQHLKVIVLLWLAGAAVSDTVIAISLTWYLSRNRTGFAHTDTALTRIIQLTLSNGMLTAGLALADIISFLSTPKGIHIAFNYALCKLYGNSLMTSLNSRAVLFQSKRSTFRDPDSSQRMSSGRSAVSPNVSKILSDHTSRSSRPAQVVVNVETHELVDICSRDLKRSGSAMEWQDEEAGAPERDDKIVGGL